MKPINNKVLVEVTKPTYYNIYSFTAGNTELLETIITDERPNKKELTKKHRVKNVIIERVANELEQYEMELNDFIEVATKIN